jgi:hypothetical protein
VPVEGGRKLSVKRTLGGLKVQPFNVCSMQELAIHQDSNQPQSGPVFDMYKNIG